MEQRPDQPPEGRLIAAAADRLDISIREAARRAGLSYGRWRQIVKGYQNISPGVYGEVRNAPARTVAKMARVVGVTAEQMETEGQRPDVAEILRQDADIRPVPGPPARRKYADDDDPVTAGYVREIHALLAEAMREHGPHFTAEDAFSEAHEIETWADLDGKMPDPEDRIRLMARIRRRVAELERQASNTGLARLVRAGHGHLPLNGHDQCG